MRAERHACQELRGGAAQVCRVYDVGIVLVVGCVGVDDQGAQAENEREILVLFGERVLNFLHLLLQLLDVRSGC